jgi:glucose/arabinose dehydrogenase
MRDFRAIRLTALLAVALLGARLVVAQPFTLQGVNSNDFRVTTFSRGLEFPLGMASLADGSLLVTLSSGANFFSSTGRVVRLTDTNFDGVADNAGTVLYSNLPGTLTGVRLAGSLVLVIGRPYPITVLRAGPTPASPLSLVGRLIITYPSGWTQHEHSGLSVRPRPGQTNQFDIFFQVGSEFNFAATTRTATLTNDNIPGASAALKGDSIHMLTLIDNGTTVSATNLTQIASGVRNPAGFAFHPTTGDFYFEDNGIDGLVDPTEPLSADELNYLARTNIGLPNQFYGYPTNYSAYRSNAIIGGAGIQPLMVFRPLPNPANGRESEGPNAITFAPPGFPNGLNTGIFLGFHGQYSLGGTNNEENPLVYAEPATGAYFHFILGQQPGIGHLDGLLATRDSLYVADLCTNGNVSASTKEGVIYQIKSLVTPTPPTLNYHKLGPQIELNWNRGTLQQATALNGPWQDVPDAFSPYTLSPTSPARLLRTRY